MAFIDDFLPEFDQEMANTRITLERLPNDKLTFRPHPRSWTMAELATHIATIPSWTPTIVQESAFDVAPGGMSAEHTAPGESQAQISRLFLDSVAQAREVLKGATEEQIQQSWSLLAGGKPLFMEPRAGVLRGMVLNHLIHHRGQLLVYLRLNDVPLPAIYGPSADTDIF